MSQVLGHVGKWEIAFKAAPHGQSGEAELWVTTPAGERKEFQVSFRRDRQGIFVQFPHGLFGYDVDGQENDDGKVSFRMSERGSDREWVGLHFTRPGEEAAVSAAAGVKKAFRIRAQMPGKIIRVMVKEGDVIEKDQAIAVMEAMKMENEIRATHDGKVKTVAVSEGQAVETGADLFVIDPV